MKTRKKKRSPAFTVEALLPTGQANPHAVINPALNRCYLWSSCHFCCHDFVWNLIDLFFFSLLFSLWPIFFIFNAKANSCLSEGWLFVLRATKLQQNEHSQIPGLIQPHSALNSYYLHLHLNLNVYLPVYLYLYWQSSFPTFLYFVSHITPVSAQVVLLNLFVVKPEFVRT